MCKISICIPIHNMENKDFFLERAKESVRSQTFQDWEIVITEDGRMAENTNSAIKKARGEIIKILYMDDWLADRSVLKGLVMLFDTFTEHEWIITASDTNKNPIWTDDIETGNNKLGSPSALAFRNRKKENLYFDERMSWLLDCDYYKRMNEKYGKPYISTGVGVNIGVGDHQMTNILTDEEKLAEHQLIKEKYAV